MARGEGGRLDVVLEPLTVLKVATTCGAEVTLNVRSEQQEWINRVSEARNSFAHRTSGSIDEEQTDGMYAISQSLKWMLRSSGEGRVDPVVDAGNTDR